MSKKNHAPGPVPPGNRPTGGPETSLPDDVADAGAKPDAGAPFSDQDPQRRLGNYQTAGEHSIVQPGAKNDG